MADIGDNDKFGPELINDNEDDIKILKYAVAIVDWASNLQGNDLVKYTFKISNNNNSHLHFVDTRDIQNRVKDIPQLLQIFANTEK